MKYLLILYIVFSLSFLGVSACTIFNAAQGDTVLVGNNEDWNDRDISVRFYTPSDGKYGRMIIIMEKTGYPFGGMNDQGLFFDWCALTRRYDIEFPSDRKYYEGALFEKMLEECATVSEAIDLYYEYNDPWLYEGHIMIVDQSGESVIIEWGTDALAVIRKETDYQVLTNFNITDPALAGWYPCWRYTRAGNMLADNTDYTLERFRYILDAVHQTGEYQTIYSNIYILNTGEVYFYDLHDYDKAVIIDLGDELVKGQKFYKLPEIFCELNLFSPSQGRELPPGQVTFSWEGNAREYHLFCSADSLFRNSQPVVINQEGNVTNESSLFLVTFIIMGMIVLAFFRRKKVTRCVLAVFFVLLVSCKKDDLFENIEALPVVDVVYTLDNLESGTQYFWKVDAFNSAGLMTESNTRFFTTGEQ